MNTRNIDILIAIVLTIVSVYLLGQTKGIPREGAIFPDFLLYSLLSCAILMVVRSIRPKYKKEYVIIFDNIPKKLWSIVVGFFIFYMIGMFYIGFYSSTFLASLGVVTIMSKENWKRTMLSNFLFSLGLTASLYLFFSLLLHVPFPDGIFF